VPEGNCVFYAVRWEPAVLLFAVGDVALNAFMLLLFVIPLNSHLHEVLETETDGGGSMPGGSMPTSVHGLPPSPSQGTSSAPHATQIKRALDLRRVMISNVGVSVLIMTTTSCRVVSLITLELLAYGPHPPRNMQYLQVYGFLAPLLDIVSSIVVLHTMSNVWLTKGERAMLSRIKARVCGCGKPPMQDHDRQTREAVPTPTTMTRSGNAVVVVAAPTSSATPSRARRSTAPMGA